MDAQLTSILPGRSALVADCWHEIVATYVFEGAMFLVIREARSGILDFVQATGTKVGTLEDQLEAVTKAAVSVTAKIEEAFKE